MGLDYFLNSDLMVPFGQRNLPYRIVCRAIEEEPFHFHDGPELLYVLEGEVDVKISRHRHVLHEGDFFPINDLEIHRIEKRDGPNLVLSLEVYGGYFNVTDTLFHFDPFCYNDTNREKTAEIKACLADIYRLHQEDEQYRERILGKIAFLLDFLIEDFQIYLHLGSFQQGRTLKERKTDVKRVRRILAYIYSHFDEKITLESLVHLEYVNKYHISRLIKMELGINFQKLLQLVRIDRAELLVLGTDFSIEEIFKIAGFASYNSFSKCFKEEYGVSPFKYRQQYKKDTIMAKPFSIDEDSHSKDEILAILDRFHLLSKSGSEEKTFSPTKLPLKAVSTFDRAAGKTLVLVRNDGSLPVEAELTLVRDVSDDTVHERIHLQVQEFSADVGKAAISAFLGKGQINAPGVEMVFIEGNGELLLRLTASPGQVKLLTLEGQWYLCI